MRFKVTLFAADAPVVEGGVVDFDKCEEMGTVFVPGETQAAAEELAHACLYEGDGSWHPVYRSEQIPHLLVVDKFNIPEGLSVRFLRFHYDYFLEKPVVVERYHDGNWVQASDDDVDTLRKKYGGIICHPENYPGTFETMNPDELPNWVKARLSA